ncbi:DNA repair protein RadA homolog [Candidatus Terasakiella magnetica]|uniref:DNA repair protein RadA n=1 Tax=Candidatus Terasakiella magnetica TaxID=1867952 RepID=A0A1C3RJT2_9PROT|nr:DNA repair protein RadA [Candidatus Terasakiella magnetica]SCA57542.1 DNA repair protein RadA homolog [Candidatus Terasakiella magnetica]
MAKTKTTFVCQSCGASYNKWQGQCTSCNEWNTLSEEAAPEAIPKGMGVAKGRKIEFVALEGEEKTPPRKVTGIGEFDRVCGGGLVPGSVILVGGDPGIGKSTILLQVMATLSAKHDCAYISGEEAIDQVRLRARRLGHEKAKVKLASATNVRNILTTLEDEKPDVVVIDSIQTLYIDTIDSAPGTVSQVRSSANELIRDAKRNGYVLFIVGHVTKEGTIAGPRVLEHMVDTVLYFEGDRGHQFRILRGVKNRFGATDEIGVFEMTEGGLQEVPNPSALFLSDRKGDVTGSCVFAGIEGSRPMLVEVQALLSPSALATPRRAIVGWDSSRLAMIMAVFDTRCGLGMGGNDVHLNIAGGLKVNEPAADLAVAAALASSLSGVAVPQETVIFGEIGLSGEVRAVGQTESRLKEAAKLGFTRAIIPERQKRGKKDKEKGLKDSGLEIWEIGHVQELLSFFPMKDK